jgi:hypothetical protein
MIETGRDHDHREHSDRERGEEFGILNAGFSSSRGTRSSATGALLPPLDIPFIPRSSRREPQTGQRDGRPIRGRSRHPVKRHRRAFTSA